MGRRRRHVEHPQSRGGCDIRPCPWIGCRHHLLFEINRSGGLQSTGPRLKRGRKPTIRRPTADQVAVFKAGAVQRICAATETCSLDVADRGPSDVRQVARLLGLTPRRVAQIESHLLARLRESGLLRSAASDYDQDEEDDMTDTTETRRHEDAIRRAHQGRRDGTLSPEDSSRIVRERNASLRAAKRGAK